MDAIAHRERLARIETYFDRTAVQAWAQMTSNAPLGRIRRTVRAGRDAMRAAILERLPDDLTGARLLDAGCGTGALSVEAARRGASIVAIDLSPKLVALAQERAPRNLGRGSIDYRVGDLLDPALGSFDHVVAMDVLIHYPVDEAAASLALLAGRTRQSLLFTFAPSTPVLAAMHAVGRLFPRGDRSPAIQPMVAGHLRRALAAPATLQPFELRAGPRVTSGFYISELAELARR